MLPSPAMSQPSSASATGGTSTCLGASAQHCSVPACPHAAVRAGSSRGTSAPTLCADAALAACRLKGTSVNVAHARSEANEKRKRTLLQEYRRVRAALRGCCRRRRWRLLTNRALQHGKAGGFIDRRFGETDASTDADEKALQRMQRLRQMQFGKASRFALGGALQRRSAPRCCARPLNSCDVQCRRRRRRGSHPPWQLAG